MKMNKKGFFPGWEYVAGFFIVAMLMVFVIGMYDFTIVELYEPGHEILNNSMAEMGITSGESYDAFNDNYDEVHNKNLPFNLFYIFVFAYAIVFSLINVAKQTKMEPMELIFKTIGGLIFFLYMMELVLFKVTSYFQIQIIDYIFQDLILSYIPFHAVTLANAGLIILIWGIALLITNFYLGKAKEQTGVFG